MNPAAATSDTAASRLAALRERGGDRADPVRFRYLEALARRLEGRRGRLRRQLDSRFLDALAAYEQGVDATPGARADSPSPAPGPSLAELTRLLDGRKEHPTEQQTEHPTAPELKAVQNFRQTWAALSTARQVSRAIEQGPENAGPLNSHQLVLRALARMRDISPAYLSHFVAHVDTLLRLERVDSIAPPAPRKGRARRR